ETMNPVHLVDNEHGVIAETIEIETHSPTSPNAAALLAATQQPVLSPIQYATAVTSSSGQLIVNPTLIIHGGMNEYITDTGVQETIIEEIHDIKAEDIANETIVHEQEITTSNLPTPKPKREPKT